MNSVDIVFANEYFVVVNKPAGTLTVPSHQGRADPRPVIGILLQTQLNTPVFPIHRLDVEVSGLVLFAIQRDAHRDSNQWFEQHRVTKTYRAWTLSQGFAHIPAHVSNPRQSLTLHPNQTMEWRGQMARNKRRAFISPSGKPSQTRAMYLGQDATTGFLQWDLEPITGRPHQLRLDLSRHGFPVLGDELYGSDYRCEANSIALIAWRLNFNELATAARFGLPALIEHVPHCPVCRPA